MYAFTGREPPPPDFWYGTLSMYAGKACMTWFNISNRVIRHHTPPDQRIFLCCGRVLVYATRIMDAQHRNYAALDQGTPAERAQALQADCETLHAAVTAARVVRLHVVSLIAVAEAPRKIVLRDWMAHTDLLLCVMEGAFFSVQRNPPSVVPQPYTAHPDACIVPDELRRAVTSVYTCYAVGMADTLSSAQPLRVRATLHWDAIRLDNLPPMIPHSLARSWLTRYASAAGELPLPAHLR